MSRIRAAGHTTPRTPLRYIATINGTRLLIVGLGDGGIHAIKPQTGEKVWSFVAAKRAINTGVVVSGSTVIISHGDENLTGNEMGMIAAHRRRADRRHQSDEMGALRRAVRLLVSARRRHARVSD